MSNLVGNGTRIYTILLLEGDRWNDDAWGSDACLDSRYIKVGEQVIRRCTEDEARGYCRARKADESPGMVARASRLLPWPLVLYQFGRAANNDMHHVVLGRYVVNRMMYSATICLMIPDLQ